MLLNKKVYFWADDSAGCFVLLEFIQVFERFVLVLEERLYSRHINLKSRAVSQTILYSFQISVNFHFIVNRFECDEQFFEQKLFVRNLLVNYILEVNVFVLPQKEVHFLQFTQVYLS
ncbi:Hypothetical_protein [Hexamita inflata]|uniref:Hypothetical_protein n=1 Tax=Hexamita inflata TaxID=28002 RepID=A0AA86PIC0_9EUKA|nr:Hypothetical protein HINF_LOCUS23917 [Hexamita inflata]